MTSRNFVRSIEALRPSPACRRILCRVLKDRERHVKLGLVVLGANHCSIQRLATASKNRTKVGTGQGLKPFPAEPYMTLRTLNELFYSVVDRNLDRAMIVRRGGTWKAISGREIYRNVVGVAYALASWGIGKGDRVAILSENRPEWAIADFAAMALGASTVPIYATLTPEQTLQLLEDSGARVIFVSSHDQLRKVLEIKHRCALEKIALMDDGAPEGVAAMAPMIAGGPTARDAAFDARALAVAPDDLATIIYTSGTTGTPKGAMLTQNNLASNLMYSLDGYEVGPGKVVVSFLPLAHITARHLDYAMLWKGVTLAYCPFHEQLLSALTEVRPHLIVAVPRVYEKISNAVRCKSGEGMKRKIFDWALGVGRKHKDEVLAGKRPSSVAWRLANELVFSKVRQAMGDRVQYFVSGGAPLGGEMLDWYASIGIRICEGYGLTETSPVIALNNPQSYRAGSVGRMLANVAVHIADDGEVMVKGPSVFKGYWNRPLDTENAFEGEWFHTGDVGRVDADGFLYITDRKKDLIKTSGGKFIAPQPIESRLKDNLLVAEAVLIADRRKFPSMVIVPNFDALEQWCRANIVPAGSRERMIANPRVIALYESVLAEVNKDLAQFEKIKKFLLIAEEFTVASGALTPTMKLKRRFVEERYRPQIEAIYDSIAEVQAR